MPGANNDIDTWSIGQLPNRSSAADALAREFQAGLSEELRRDILTARANFRKAVANAERFKASAKGVRSGKLFAAREVFGSEDAAAPEALGSPFVTSFEGNTYRLESRGAVLGVLRALAVQTAAPKPFCSGAVLLDRQLKRR